MPWLIASVTRGLICAVVVLEGVEPSTLVREDEAYGFPRPRSVLLNGAKPGAEGVVMLPEGVYAPMARCMMEEVSTKYGTKEGVRRNV